MLVHLRELFQVRHQRIFRWIRDQWGCGAGDDLWCRMAVGIGNSRGTASEQRPAMSGPAAACSFYVCWGEWIFFWFILPNGRFAPAGRPIWAKLWRGSAVRSESRRRTMRV